MDKCVRDVFNDVCKHVVIDNAFSKRVERYLNEFISKNPDHASFFGGNLIGVHPVRFTPNDRLKFFDEILTTDEDLLESRCHALINPIHYNIASNVFNLACVWLLHKTWHSKLNDKQKRDTMVNIANIMQIRFYTSRMSRHWEYPCSKEIAEATLAAMSNKYDIKQKGNWINVIKARSEDLCDMKKSIHRQVIDKMERDLSNTSSNPSVGYLLTDTQGRIKAMILGIYGLQKEIQTSGIRINSLNGTYINLDGEEQLRDNKGGNEIYRTYLSSIVADKPSFIKLDLVNILEEANKTMPASMFRTTLSFICDAYGKGDKGKLEIDDILNDVMTHVFVYLSQNKNAMKNQSDIAGLISKLKGIYGASRTSDELLLKIRDNVENIVRRATKIKSGPAIASTRTGVMLYIVLRAFTMKHYSG